MQVFREDTFGRKSDRSSCRYRPLGRNAQGNEKLCREVANTTTNVLAKGLTVWSIPFSCNDRIRTEGIVY
jgi:hypothetical protein